VSAIELSAGVDVDRPADDVWRIVADYARDPDWRAGVVTMAPSTVGPVQAGTSTAEELRMAGSTWRNTGVVTDVEPGRRFSWRTTSGVPASGSRSVVPVSGGRSRVELRLAVTPTGAQRLMRPVLAGMLRRGLAADAERLRQVAEREAATG
jgi:uncharacterized membrane protein